MATENDRKYIKTKFEGVYYRLSAKRDPRTGEFDKIYYFWYSDQMGKGHWKSVGKHSQGIRLAAVKTARARFIAEMSITGMNPIEVKKVTIGQAVEAYIAWGRSEGKSGQLFPGFVLAVLHKKCAGIP